MKITAILTTYNEVLFLDYCIRSIYKFVDEIIMIDCGMQSSIDAGYGAKSTDGTEKIIDKWLDEKKVFLATNPAVPPKTFKECFNIGFEMAKERNADWAFFITGDEIWTDKSLTPLRSILKQCDTNGVLGLNVWMYFFGPDFWHWRDFRNPRFSRVTEDSVLAGDVSLFYPKKNVWQFAGDIENPYPPGTPIEVQKINKDYPRNLRPYHYSCVGYERVKLKAEQYIKLTGKYGDPYVEAYMNKDWERFNKMGFKKFAGKHPEIMKKHPLYNERMF